MNAPFLSSTLTRQTLTSVALRIAVVVAVATVISYWHVYSGLQIQALQQLSEYVQQRGTRESHIFMLAEDNLKAFAQDYANRLKALGDADPKARFEQLFERSADGNLRLRKALFERHQVTGFIGKYVDLDADLRRRLVVGFDMVAQYGPAWQNRFENLYVTTAENAILMYWPGKPWALNVKAWEVHGKLVLTAPEGATVLVVDDQHQHRNDTAWSKLYFDYVVNDWLLSVTEPVQVSDRHAISVGHDILLRELIERTINNRLDGTYNVIFRADGRLIAHPLFMDAIRARNGELSLQDAGDPHLLRMFDLIGQKTSDEVIIDNSADNEFLAVTRLQGPDWYFLTVFPKAIIMARALTTARLILVLGLVALLLELAILLSVFRKQVAKPLAHLLQATNRIAAGDFTIRLDARRRDEIGRLTRSFNIMSQEIDARETALNERSATLSRLNAQLEQELEERNRAEQDRLRWLQLLQDAIESLPNGFALFDADKRLVISNTAFAALYGVDTEQLTNATAAEILPCARPLIHTLDGQPPGSLETTIERYFSCHEPIEVELNDGRWLLVHCHPTTEGGVVFLRTDITTVKRMEQALRDSEQRFRTIVETHPVPSAIFSVPDYQLLYASPNLAELFGLPPEQLLAEPIEHFYLDQADREYLKQTLASSGVLDSYELRVRKPDGATLELSISAKPINYQGRRAILASLLDLTERKKAEAELARHREALYQSEKLSALGSLLAGVAHELNNPLSVVVGRSLMLEEQLNESALAKSVAKLRSSAERCARIVKVFLAMARRQEPSRMAVQIENVIEGALEMVGYGLRSAGIEVTLDIEPELPELDADPDQLTQVFTNLFINAQQALAMVPEPRHLAIAAWLEQDMLCIRVADNGPGIPKHVLPRIFEPFFTTKPVGEGTGVGLSVCHNIMHSHGGEITVERPKGGGTAFMLKLPGAAFAATDDSAETQSPADSAGRHILIVDDEPDVADMLGDILTAAGHRIETADSGRTALKYLHEHDFDLIVSDLRMPDLDGPGLYEELQKTQPTLCARMVFVTGDTLGEAAKRFLTQAERPVIEKPFVPDDVRAVVNRELEQAKAS